MQDAWKPKHNPWAIALTVTLATFMLRYRISRGRWARVAARRRGLFRRTWLRMRWFCRLAGTWRRWWGGSGFT
jgi:hypothetical protein